MKDSALGPQTPRTTPSYSLLRSNCVCPISQDIMRDPVIAADGNTYERKDIQKVFNAARQAGQIARSPLTRKPFTNSTLIVNQGMRSSIGQLPESDLLPVGHTVTDAFTEAPVPASNISVEARAASLQVPGTGPRTTIQPLSREAAMDRLGLVSAATTAPPTFHSMMRSASLCHTLNAARGRIRAAQATIEATLNGVAIPSAFVEKQQKKREKASSIAAMTCGASYLCAKGAKSDSQAASYAYCLGGTLIGSLACPVFCGPILVDACCCRGIFTACTVACLGVCGGACAGEVHGESVQHAYVHKIVEDWSNSARSSFTNFDRNAADAVYYKKEFDTRPGADGRCIVTLRPEAITHQQDYVHVLSDFADWCAAKNLSAKTCELVHAHLANLRAGSSYHDENDWAL